MVEVTLTEPIEAHGETVEVLKIQEPKGKHFKKITGKSMEAPIAMILEFGAILANVPPSAFDELCADDVSKVIEAVGPFLAGSQLTGKM